MQLFSNSFDGFGTELFDFYEAAFTLAHFLIFTEYSALLFSC